MIKKFPNSSHTERTFQIPLISIWRIYQFGSQTSLDSIRKLDILSIAMTMVIESLPINTEIKYNQFYLIPMI